MQTIQAVIRDLTLVHSFRIKVELDCQICVLKKLERTQRIRGERLERVAYDPKTGWKVRGYCRLNEHDCFLWHSTKIMYICGKLNFTICMYTIFPISMQKTVRAQIGPVKKKLPFWVRECDIPYNFIDCFSQFIFFKITKAVFWAFSWNWTVVELRNHKKNVAWEWPWKKS